MLSYSTTTEKFSVSSSKSSDERFSRMTPAGATLLSNDANDVYVNRVFNTVEDVRGVDGNSRRGLSRNQGIIDKRCKAVRGRLAAEVQRRKIQRSIDQLDALMQKLLESQDPANEKMYDLYAERKAELEAQL
jgi:hypothetical protein